MKVKDQLAQGFGPHLGIGDSSIWYQNWLGTGKLCHKVPFDHISDIQLRVANICVNRSWNLDVLYTSLPPDISNAILHVKVPSENAGPDRIQWKATPDGNYTTVSSYQFMSGVGTIDVRGRTRTTSSSSDDEGSMDRKKKKKRALVACTMQ